MTPEQEETLTAARQALEQAIDALDAAWYLLVDVVGDGEEERPQ